MATKQNSNTGRTTKACNCSGTKKSGSKSKKNDCCDSKKSEDCHSMTGVEEGLDQLEFYRRLFKQLSTGEDGLETLRGKISDPSLKRLVEKHRRAYEQKESELIVKINALDGEPEYPNLMMKLMQRSSTVINTMIDDSPSKVAEIVLQGINMGIIAVTRLINQGSDMGLDIEEGQKVLNLYKAQTDALQNYL